MLIGIDGNEANISTRVGVGQFAFNILWQISKLDYKNQYIVYLKNPPLADLPPSSPNWQYKVFGPRKFWTKFALPFHLYTQKEKLNLFYSTSHYSPHSSPFPTIPTIHDLGYLKTQHQFQKKDIYQLINWTKNSIKKANHIVTVSEFTKNEVSHIYKVDPRMVSVVANGISPPPPSSLDQDLQALTKYNITRPYFLYLGTLKPNKNLPFLIESFSAFLKLQSSKAPSYQLVIAGKKGWLFEDIFAVVKKLQLEKQVIFTDYVSDSDRFSLYRQALATVLPSTYEGFGVPAIESMLVNTPVIVSDIPAFKEVCANAALYIDSSDQKSLVTQLSKVLQMTPATKSQWVKRGIAQAHKLTWENSAKNLLKVFEKFQS